ncbi:MAG: Translation initiation factor IF-3 [Candidatus Woesebacteria bacterium GW2011_GWB1_38_5]|uniref:Translation initiation factor IF-3 n=3 Tax=Candidatus Woeseibacteriota TaxID=1752722 RepID=A0A0G0KY22_9BACT|nr:MAG: Translation initiation factor IF-3 [Candidatus Woesebacteria bacterium GW2011_GWD1_38_10]KKQ75581.1 MAG: Translation initiation factor IF-3 [Candidatus Woesebacteria bacterium GW2011_GWB1_38_5]KKQ84528.1 MAG: Translation initiation factor IF-3 [Candidatus Woesebacteria bacterium GW2011_GWA1_38_8]
MRRAQPQTINYRINHQIKAPELRVVSSDGKQMGVVPTHQAIQKALEEGLTLVEVAPNAKPPVAKIVDLGKFKYEIEKKARKEKRGVKGGDTKEVRFSPFIGEHDYNTRLARVTEFLEDKDKVRLVVQFTRRQLGSKQFGYDLLAKITKSFGERVGIDMQPKFLGRNLMMVISPKAVVKKKVVEESPKEG